MPYEDNKVSCNGRELHLDEDVEAEEEVVVVGILEQQEAISIY